MIMQTQTQKKKGFRLSLIAIVALTLTLVLIFSACSANKSTEGNSNTESAAVTDNTPIVKDSKNLVIPTSEISGTAKFYPVTVDGTKMEVIAVKAADGSIRTAFNTCQVCFSSGRGYYKQQGDLLVCQNCGNKFPMSRVEVEAGGCNPWPIFAKDKTVTEESITISYDFMNASKQIFANWKTSY